ncbi:conserved hypothetical protein [Microcystis aeruginosa PCC 7941]|nr:conserved hypothetical protein [Microcystis aeruginosa PCC 7941]
MRNVNLNILKFLESMNNFCLSLSNIELGDRSQLSVISYQLSVISYQLSVISYQLSVISYQLSVN